MPYKTIELKLHNPGRRKRDIMDEALHRYSSALQYLLDRAWQDPGLFTGSEGGISLTKVSAWLAAGPGTELKVFGIEPFRDSLFYEFTHMAKILAPAVSSLQDTMPVPPSFLTSREALEKRWNEMLDNVSRDTSEPGELKQLTRLQEKLFLPNSVFFCRYAASRNYCLLYDRPTGRFYAKLYLMNNQDADRVPGSGQKASSLEYVLEGRKPFRPQKRRETYILVPLEFGAHQEKLLHQALEQPRMFKTARLYKRGASYYLRIHLELEMPAPLETTSAFGLYLSRSGFVYACVDQLSGEVGHTGSFPLDTTALGSGVRSRTLAAIYRAAGQAAKLAVEQKAQVVLENPRFFSRKVHPYKTSWLGCRFDEALDRHLAEAGLPLSLKVRYDSTRVECSKCGMINQNPVILQNIFICKVCGHASDLALLAAVNLAKRADRYRNSYLKVHQKVIPSGIHFECRLLGLSLTVEDRGECYSLLWEYLRQFSEQYYANLPENLKDSRQRRLYGLAKKIKQSHYLHEVIKIV